MPGPRKLVIPGRAPVDRASTPFHPVLGPVRVAPDLGDATVIGRLLGRRPILSEREQDLRAREQELLERLATALGRFGSDETSELAAHVAGHALLPDQAPKPRMMRPFASAAPARQRAPRSMT